MKQTNICRLSGDINITGLFSSFILSIQSRRAEANNAWGSRRRRRGKRPNIDQDVTEELSDSETDNTVVTADSAIKARRHGKRPSANQYLVPYINRV